MTPYRLESGRSYGSPQPEASASEHGDDAQAVGALQEQGADEHGGDAAEPAFYTPAGVGTQFADGGLPWRYGPDGSVSVASPPKETREFRSRTYLLEEAVTTDFSLVRAARGDRHGNLNPFNSRLETGA
ncbi:acyl CoA:acetate/3-ketoacid CoA transferase alpha subunit [Streptomyces canus]|nr:acyl CoA:acetate/3-ketoacid CoA transferase alpha subunit [Streptomyces canus]